MNDKKVYMNASYGSVKEHYGGKTFPFIADNPPSGHDLSNPIDVVLNHGGKYTEGVADYMANTVTLVLAHIKAQEAAKDQGDIGTAPVKVIVAAPLIPPGNIATLAAHP